MAPAFHSSKRHTAMKRRGLWLLFLLVLVLFLGGGLWLWVDQHLVTRRVEVYTGYDAMAQRNGFYIAERLLNRLGVKAHSVRRLSDIPDPLGVADTVLMALPTNLLGAAETEHWLAWVAQGGHLVMAIGTDYTLTTRTDHMLNRLQVHSHPMGSPPTHDKATSDAEVTPDTETEAAPEAEAEAEAEAADQSQANVESPAQAQAKTEQTAPDTDNGFETCKRPEPDTVIVQLSETAPLLQVEFRSRLRLNGNFWQQIPWGKGQVTLLTDIGPFTNTRLDDHDHSDFLWALLQQPARGGEVWLQYQMQFPSLALLVWQHLWMPLTGLVLTVLALLWLSSQRLGPLLTPRANTRRRLGEHLRASSRFLWRQGAGPVLVQAARYYGLQRSTRQRLKSTQNAALSHSDQPLTDSELITTLQTLQRSQRPPL